MNKEALLVVALLSTLFFAGVAGTQLIQLAKSNPIMHYPVFVRTVAPDQYTKPPTISIRSLKNNTIYGVDTFYLTFNTSIGDSKTASSCLLEEIYYETDWQSNKTYLYKCRHDWVSYYTQPRYAEFSGTINVTGIPDGNRTIIVTVVESGRYELYVKQDPYDNRNFAHYYNNFTIIGSSLVRFSVDATPPVISVLSLENKTYYSPEIQLNFTVNEKPSLMVYSLDGQENVTVAGNTTLTKLPYGDHNITVYATDKAGNIGAAETIYFSVEEPFPIIVVAPIVPVAIISAGLLLHFKKCKSWCS
jgi:hypothetical protein